MSHHQSRPGQAQETKSNAHTNVLGMDGSDLIANSPPDRPSSATSRRTAVRNWRPPSPSQQFNQQSGEVARRKKWWGSLGSWSSKKPADATCQSSEYQSLEEAAAAEHDQTNLPQSLLQPSGLKGPVSSAACAIQHDANDPLREECSFFYEGMEDGPEARSPTMRERLSHLGENGLIPYVLHGGLASATVQTRSGGLFRAEYNRLNQDFVFGPEENELRLSLSNSQEESIEFTPTARNYSSNIQNSTIVFEQNGRLLLRLPRDQVRLIMDPDLEAGIISVEQWRREQQSDNLKEEQKDEPLSYALSVPDDLYRRVVSEMSDGLSDPTNRWCHATDRVDIRVALAILFVIMILLMIGSLEWPTE